MGAAAGVMGLLSTAATLYGGYSSYKSQKESGDVQRDAAAQQTRVAGLQEQQAGAQEAAAIEQQRISEGNVIRQAEMDSREEEATRMTAKQEEGKARAAAAASGVTLSGSTGAILSEQERINQDEFSWLQKANQSNINVMNSQIAYDRKQADIAAQSTRIGADTTRAGAAMTEAGADQTSANAYGSLLGAGKSAWDIGSRSNWYGLG